MRVFEQRAPDLAVATIGQLDLGAERDRITHLVVTSCTGFSAPGIDLQVLERCGLPTSVERTMVGFMGCSAAINGLKVARHIVRSEPDARVLVLNLELCTLHLQETLNIAQLLCFLLFADGCAASLVTAEPKGIALDSFRAVLVPDSRELMAWNIRDVGFDMVLSGKVPRAIHDALRASVREIIGAAPMSSIDLWAVHPGGHSILDAVDRAFALPPDALAPSREVLRRYGNMSSATVMFVLNAMMRSARLRRARLRHGVRAGADRGNHAVPNGRRRVVVHVAGDVPPARGPVAGPVGRLTACWRFVRCGASGWTSCPRTTRAPSALVAILSASTPG